MLRQTAFREKPDFSLTLLDQKSGVFYFKDTGLLKF